MTALEVYALLSKKIATSSTSIKDISLTEDRRIIFEMADGSSHIIDLPIKQDCIDFIVVDTLPTEDISLTSIYFVPKTKVETNKRYDQYMYLDNQWELIGNVEFDKESYYTKAEMDKIIEDAAPLIATPDSVGLVKPDDNSIIIDKEGTMSVSSVYMQNVIDNQIDSQVLEVTNQQIADLFQ